MITPPPEYTVMGGDGKEYRQVPAAQIRQWFTEGRLEEKSPIIPPDAKDWVFLQSLPEFADLFQPPAPAPKSGSLAWKLAVIAGTMAGLLWLLWWVTHKIHSSH